MSIVDLFSGGAETGLLGGVLAVAGVLGGVFRWLVRRQDRLYDKSEEMHRAWLDREQADRERDRARAAEDRARLDSDVADLRRVIDELRRDLTQCRADCEEARRGESAAVARADRLAARVASLEKIVNGGETT